MKIVRKFTAGPWEVVGKGRDVYVRTVADTDLHPFGIVEMPIAKEIGGFRSVVDGKRDFTEVEANARLLAKAPELFDVLEDLIGEVLDIRGIDVEEYKPAVFARARAILRAAAGEV
jgi:hypothetical protein